MSAVLECIDAELVDESTQFFAPVSSDLLDGLLGQYQATRKRIEAVAEFVGNELASGAIDYFLEGNSSPDRGRHSLSNSAKSLFEAEGAIKALNAAYWSKALAFTDVLDTMPQARRNEWHKSIRELDTPDFTEDAARSTIGELLRMRGQFFGERVDGIFRGLSGEHVTNAPEAFGKRMIIARVLTCYDTSDSSTCGLINDLRCVIAKFMGRDEPKYDASLYLVQTLKANWGQWVTIDGGALKIRLYKKGTAHMEVHPDLAWRLNQVLASLHPLAIPAEFRQKPKRRAKDYLLMGRPLPFAVLDVLAQTEQHRERLKPDWPESYRRIPNTVAFRYAYTRSAAGQAEAEGILVAIGGVKIGAYYEFDYDPREAIQQIVVSGCIPDQVAHQFYPTPAGLAERLVAMAEIGAEHTVLEPSAGQGGLFAFLPVERTTCVEVAAMNAKVLQAKGANVECADFLAWSLLADKHFDRVVMNPPFSDGRATAHTEAAASLVKPGGILVAILPSGHATRLTLAGFDCEYTQPIDNAFPGVSVSVVILKAVRT